MPFFRVVEEMEKRRHSKGSFKPNGGGCVTTVTEDCCNQTVLLGFKVLGPALLAFGIEVAGATTTTLLLRHYAT